MGTRLELHEELLSLAPNVYFQPPSSVKLSYPCIVYHLSDIDTLYADNRSYKNFKSYLVTYISRRPNDEKVDEILNHFSYCRFDRPYVADNLQHYAFVLFY